MNNSIVTPASDWCQRWSDKQHTWKHKSDGGFDSAQYTVEPISEAVAKGYVTTHHYSGSYPAASLRYGLFLHGALVGVCVLGIPVQTKALTNVFPDLEPFTESLELSRFVLADECPSNTETWFLARCFEAAAVVGLRGVVSFADPTPRVVDGALLFPGHIGLIYQASNALYAGRGTARTLTLFPNGEVFNDRSKQKVRKQERGHESVERLLVSLGASVPRSGDDRVRWLASALDDVRATRLRHRGCHRYVFTIGTRAQRRRVLVNHAPMPYPKERDAA